MVNDAIIDNVVSQNPSQTQSVNAGQTSSSGFEAEIKQNSVSYVQWFANYTYIKSEVEDAGTVPFAPSNIGNVGVNLATLKGTNISTYMNYNDGFYDSSDESSRNFFKPGLLLNLKYISAVSQG